MLEEPCHKPATPFKGHPEVTLTMFSVVCDLQVMFPMLLNTGRAAWNYRTRTSSTLHRSVESLSSRSVVFGLSLSALLCIRGWHRCQKCTSSQIKRMSSLLRDMTAQALLWSCIHSVLSPTWSHQALRKGTCGDYACRWIRFVLLTRIFKSIPSKFNVISLCCHQTVWPPG